MEKYIVWTSTATLIIKRKVSKTSKKCNRHTQARALRSLRGFVKLW